MPGIFSRCFAESVPKSSFRDLGTKSEPKRAKRDRKQFKMEPKYDQHDPNGTKRGPKGCQPTQKLSKIMPWSVRSFRFSTLSSFLEKGKNGHGALVGLTYVKGTSVDKFF